MYSLSPLAVIPADVLVPLPVDSAVLDPSQAPLTEGLHTFRGDGMDFLLSFMCNL